MKRTHCCYGAQGSSEKRERESKQKESGRIMDESRKFKLQQKINQY